MLFPQFTLYDSKKSLTYVDLNNILTLVVNLRQTWNYSAFKKATHRTWMVFKDKLTDEQKIILRNAIVSLRTSLFNELREKNTVWLSSGIVLSLLSLTSPYLLSFQKRQVILKNQLYSLEAV